MLSALFIVSASLVAAQTLETQIVNVASPQELSPALQAAQSSEQPVTLRLARGDYPPFTLTNIVNPLRIEALDPQTPPHLLGLKVQDSTNLSFANLIFDFRFDPTTSELWSSVFRFENSNHLSFDQVLVDGALMTGTGTDGDDYPAGRGLHFARTQNVTITDSEVRGLWVGLSVTESRNFTLRRNYLHGVRKDILTLAQVQDVEIDGNYFGAFNRSFAFDDHPDMIQMWTARTSDPSERVNIRNNVFNSGHGPWSQTIFFRNELVDRGDAGSNMFYRDVAIDNNLIINSHIHGIFVGETRRLSITNNTLVRNFRSEEDGMSDALAAPQIRIAEQNQEVMIARNVAAGLPQSPIATNWVIHDNVVIQSTAIVRNGHYRDVFVDALSGDPEDLRSYQFNPDGPLHNQNIGANLATLPRIRERP